MHKFFLALALFAITALPALAGDNSALITPYGRPVAGGAPWGAPAKPMWRAASLGGPPLND